MFWRSSPAQFQILQSSDGAVRTVPLGLLGDNAKVIADYDGDGRTDPAVFRSSPSGDRFIYIGSFNNPAQNPTTVFMETSSGFPNPGDYDGDLKADCCVQSGSGSLASFTIHRSKDGVTEVDQFGSPTDVVTSADFDGDRRDDLITMKGASGSLNWSVLERDGGGTGGVPIVFGASATDFACGGDYDGDGKFDIATWTPSATAGASNFKVRRSSDGETTTFNFGQNGDFPVGNIYSH